MNYSIFKCNPEYYCLAARLEVPRRKITWRVTRFQDKIKKGDLAFIWRTGPKKGIYGVIKITAPPKDMDEISTELPFQITRDDQRGCRVTGVPTHRYQAGLLAEELESKRGLQALSVFSGFRQGTNYEATSIQGSILLRLIEARIAK